MEADIFDDNNFSDNSSFDDFNSFDGFSDAGYSPMEKHNDLLKQLTEFEKYLKKMVAEWMGMVWSEEKSRYVKSKYLRPIMDIRGARWCMNQMRVYARDNNIITDLDQQNFRFIMEDVIDTTYLNLGSRAEEFGINNDGDLILVANQLIHTAMLILLGTAGERNYKDLISTTTTRSENVSMTPQPVQENKQKPSWLDRARMAFR